MDKIDRHPAALPPAPAVMAILSRYDRRELESFIQIAIDLTNTMDGDSDLEEVPLEDAFVAHDPAFWRADSDAEAGAYVEWHTMRGSQKGGPNLLAGLEDDEDDDPDTDVEDELIPLQAQLKRAGYGPGCELSDPGGCEHDGREIEDGY